MRSIDLTRLDAEDFLSALGVENVQRVAQDEVRFSCPFSGHSHGDETPSAYMNTGERDEEKCTLWKCHGCGRSGNAVGFLALHEGISRERAALYIRQEYDATFREPEDGSFAGEWDRHFARSDAPPPEANPPLAELGDAALDHFHVDWTDAWSEWTARGYEGDGPLGYMFRRGFDPETLERFEVGYDERSQRFTIPIRNLDGELIGFKGRAWNGDPRKYMVIGDTRGGSAYGFAPYEAKAVVYGLHDCEPGSEVAVVEGELNRIAMWQKGYPNSCAVGGANTLNEAQVEQVRSRARSVVLFFDSLKPRKEGEIGPAYVPDIAGVQATLRAIEAFEPHMRCRVVGTHVGDPADMDAGTIRSLVEGAESSLSITMDFGNITG